MKLSERIREWTHPTAEYDDDFDKVLLRYADEVAQLEEENEGNIKQCNLLYENQRGLIAKIEVLENALAVIAELGADHGKYFPSSKKSLIISAMVGYALNPRAAGHILEENSELVDALLAEQESE